MRLSEIQQRRNLPPDAQPIPLRRAVGWLLVGIAIAFGVALFFRHARTLLPLLN